MIELNLLPKELKKRKKMILPEVQFLPLSAALLAFVLALNMSGAVAILNKKRAMVKAEKIWQDLLPEKKKAEELLREIKNLDLRAKVIKEIASPSVNWTELFMGLNQAMISNVWLSGFKPVASAEAQSKGGSGVFSLLEIDGYALGKGEATSTVGKFIDGLKNSAMFFKYFSDVELQEIRQQKFENEDVMRFRLRCELKKAVEAAKPAGQAKPVKRKKDDRTNSGKSKGVSKRLAEQEELY